MKIEKLIKDTYELDKKIKNLTEKRKVNKNKIQMYFDKNNISEYNVDISEKIQNTNITVKKIERININYFADKLKKKLEKDIFFEIANNVYYINDIRGLIGLLKKTKIKPNEFKKYIDVKTTIDKKAIEQLFAVGDITSKDLDGCYEAKIIKSIQFKESGKGGTD